MKTLTILILLAVAFLAGHHYGRQPGSPDLTVRAKQACVEAGQSIYRAVSAADRPAAASPPTVSAENVVLRLAGKTYVLGPDATQPN